MCISLAQMQLVMLMLLLLLQTPTQAATASAAAAATAAASDVAESGLACTTAEQAAVPNSGFVSVSTILHAALPLRVLSRRARPQRLCTSLRLTGLPDKKQQAPNEMFGDTFHAQLEEIIDTHGTEARPAGTGRRYRLVNGRYVYSNGRDLLSYVRQEVGGTWIINTREQPGTDTYVCPGLHAPRFTSRPFCPALTLGLSLPLSYIPFLL